MDISIFTDIKCFFNNLGLPGISFDQATASFHKSKVSFLPKVTAGQESESNAKNEQASLAVLGSSASSGASVGQVR